MHRLALIVVAVMLTGCATMPVGLPSRTKAETLPFEQGKVDLKCPGKMKYYIFPAGVTPFFLECMKGTP